jgi:hypothetical protein
MNEMQHEALNVLSEIWGLSPDVRLGQLMAHLGLLGEVHVGKGLGYNDDDELMAVLYRHRDELRTRLAGAPNQALPPTGDGISVSGNPTLSTADPTP